MKIRAILDKHWSNISHKLDIYWMVNIRQILVIIKAVLIISMINTKIRDIIIPEFTDGHPVTARTCNDGVRSNRKFTSSELRLLRP
jgi:hypothetical protein